MSNGIDLGTTISTRWRAQWGIGGYFTHLEIGETLKFYKQYPKNAASLLKTDSNFTADNS